MNTFNTRVLMVTWGTVTVASSRVRAYQFVPYFEQHGWECHLLPINPTPFNLFQQRIKYGRKYLKKVSKLYSLYAKIYQAWSLHKFQTLMSNTDVVFVQKILFHENDRSHIKESGKLIVFEFDDALYTISEQRPSFDGMLSLADVVITTNQESMRYAKNSCSNVVQIIGPIDTNRYSPRKPPTTEHAIIIGWIGSPYTTPELKYIFDVILRVIDERPNTKFYIIGAENFPTYGDKIHLFPWQFETEIELMAQFDIGIMPLADTDWNQGKGGYKLLQYMSCGIPAVASPVGINADLIDHMETGLLATTMSEWQESLITLIDSPSLRSHISKKARKKAVEQYSLEIGASKLITAIETAIQTKMRG